MNDLFSINQPSVILEKVEWREADYPFGANHRPSDITLEASCAKTKMKAEIELMQFSSDRWMWSISCQLHERGRSYLPHPKWGKFGRSAIEAKEHALREVEYYVDDFIEAINGNDSMRRYVAAALRLVGQLAGARI